MPKPSETISKIYQQIRAYGGGNKNGDKTDAIIQYLDEQYEREHADHNIMDCIECKNTK